MRVSYKQIGLQVSTLGLNESGTQELSIRVAKPSLLLDAEQFLKFVVDYLISTGRRITAGETLNYGYWLIKFQQAIEGLEVWEFNAAGTEFIPGGNLALTYWREQHKICETQNAEFDPPRPDKLTAVSAGVLEGLPVQGVRYRWQNHMSGWLIVTAAWDQNVRSIQNHHTYHLTAKRPDLAKFIALPVGYRFDLTIGEKVWLDEEVQQQEPV